MRLFKITVNRIWTANSAARNCKDSANQKPAAESKIAFSAGFICQG